MAKVAEHVRKVHNVPTTTQTIASFVKKEIRQV